MSTSRAGSARPSGGDSLRVMTEIGRLRDVPVPCVHGTEETDSPCLRLTGPTSQSVALEGGHHFGGDYTAIAGSIPGLLR